MSKYELPISTGYVPDWTYIEAVRELFQNALDSQAETFENKMNVEYKDGVLRIKNKTSVLSLKSLLLGSTTKRNNEHTIGKHGEGYKLAFMVLLRCGKNVTVYNYGNKEVWTSKLIKSRRYGNALLPVINVEEKNDWDKEPEYNLVIEVSEITSDEYSKIVKTNLHLQTSINEMKAGIMGSILLSSEYKGCLFVNGLFVCKIHELEYGYNMAPHVIRLDRDRRVVDTFDAAWNTSEMWKQTGRADIIAEMLLKESLDVKYVSTYTNDHSSEIDKKIEKEVKEQFENENGSDAIPVKNNEQLQEVLRTTKKKPVMVAESASTYLASMIVKLPEKKSIKTRMEEWLCKVEHKLEDEELVEINEIIADI